MAGRSPSLPRQEFDLLHFLASRPGRVFSREQLLDQVWGESHFVTPRNVDAYIRRLRRKIELPTLSKALPKTVRGIGYMLEAVGVELAFQSSAKAMLGPKSPAP